MMELLELNDYCLLDVLDHLKLNTILSVSETSQRLGCLAERAFKRHKYYNCIIYNDQEWDNQAFNIIRKVGQHLIKLDLKLNMKASCYMENEVEDPFDIDTFLTLLKESVSEMLLELSINSEVCSVPLLRLCPTYVHLEKLVIHQPCDGDFTRIDLPALCPNLKVLIIKGCAIIFAPNPMKSFSHLEVFEFQAFSSFYSFYEVDIVEMFTSFIKQNKQLKKLYIDTLWHEQETIDVHIDLRELAKNLPNLEELRWHTFVSANIVQGISDMKALTNLHTLEIADAWDDLDQMNGILQSLTALKHLKHLSIGTAETVVPDQQSIIAIAVALKLLQSFKCNFRFEIKTITEFIRHSRNLNMICMNLMENVATANIVRHIAEARKSAAGRKHQPLTIDFHRVGYTLDVYKAFEEPNVGRFLQLYMGGPSFDESSFLWSNVY